MNESDADELRRLRYENEVLRQRKGILDAGAISLQAAQTAKCNAEVSKLAIKTRLYPFVVLAGFIAAITAGTKLLLG